MRSLGNAIVIVSDERPCGEKAYRLVHRRVLGGALYAHRAMCRGADILVLRSARGSRPADGRQRQFQWIRSVVVQTMEAIFGCQVGRSRRGISFWQPRGRNDHAPITITEGIRIVRHWIQIAWTAGGMSRSSPGRARRPGQRRGLDRKNDRPRSHYPARPSDRFRGRPHPHTHRFCWMVDQIQRRIRVESANK
jgi:hypothetical protein